MTMKHTPTPWYTDTEYFDGKYYAIHSKNGRFLAQISHLVKQPSDNGRFSQEEVANAELIVTAVNNYYALESQVKELREALDKTMNIICDHRGVFPAFRHFMEDEEIQSIEKLQRKLLNKQP